VKVRIISISNVAFQKTLTLVNRKSEGFNERTNGKSERGQKTEQGKGYIPIPSEGRTGTPGDQIPVSRGSASEILARISGEAPRAKSSMEVTEVIRFQFITPDTPCNDLLRIFTEGTRKFVSGFGESAETFICLAISIVNAFHPFTTVEGGKLASRSIRANPRIQTRTYHNFAIAIRDAITGP